MKGSTLRKRFAFLMQCAKGANDRKLSKGLSGRLTFFGKAMGLSPMPGLATHMHRDTMSPLYDWETLVFSIKDRLEQEGLISKV